jgi:hypothetical protein
VDRSSARPIGCSGPYAPSVEARPTTSACKTGLLGYQIKDSSTNGLYVNAQRVVGERWLRVGDAVGVGPAQLRFEADAAMYEPDGSAIDIGNLPPLAAAPSLAPDESRPPPNETVRLSRRAEPTTTEAPLLATLEAAQQRRTQGQAVPRHAAAPSRGTRHGHDVALRHERLEHAREAATTRQRVVTCGRRLEERHVRRRQSHLRRADATPVFAPAHPAVAASADVSSTAMRPSRRPRRGSLCRSPKSPGYREPSRSSCRPFR